MDETMFSEETRAQAAVFDRIGAEYETVFGGNPRQISAVAWLIKHLEPGSYVLDAGCGTGIPTARMLSEAGNRVLGVDISHEMVRIARDQVPGAEFVLMDIANLSFQQPMFHAVTAFFSLLMLRRSAVMAALQRLASLLLPDGYMIVAMVGGDLDYAPIAFLDIPVHVTAYPRDEFAELLVEAGLRVLDIQTVEFLAEADEPSEIQHFYFCQRDF